MKTAFAIWNGRISPVFDTTRQVLLLDTRDGAVVEKREATIPADDPIRTAKELAGLEIEALVCGAISRELAGTLAAYGIRTYPFIAGEVEEVIAAYRAGSLQDPELAMPGCRGRRNSCRGKPGRRRNMPNQDGTGPAGQGPRTGRGRGNCGNQEKRNPTGGGGQGRGRGRGPGQGRGRGSGQGGRR